jgi:molecular chaperone GrpE
MAEEVEQGVGHEQGDPSMDPRAQTEMIAGGEARAGDAQGEEPTIETLQSVVAQAREEAAASQDKYLRTLAEMDNYKKRIERTYADLSKSSKKNLLTKLLSVKDNLERALQYGGSSENGEGILEGVRLTQYQLDQILSQEGVTEMESDGKPFDPRLEEAIQSVSLPDKPDHQVVQVVRKGYTLGDDVLRPAQVIVNVRSE